MSVPSSSDIAPLPASKKLKIYAVAGLILILIALLMDHYSGSPPKADAQVSAQCRKVLQERGAEGTLDPDQCDEKAFATAMTAEANGMSANSAAAIINSANRTEVGGHSVSIFVLGIGIAMMVGSVIILLLGKRQEKS